MAGDADPFDQFDAGKTSATAQPADANVFDQFGPQAVEPTSATGAFARGAALGAAPAAGGLVAAGAGAEAGAVIGAFGGPVGALAGGVIGGGVGAYAGASGVAEAQKWLLSKLPEDWKESIDSEEQADQAQHPIASFLGGLAPYAVTLSPGGLGKAAAELPENATAFQKIMAHPLTARLFGGAAMGGMEVAQEKAQGEPINWTDTAIATGFGMVFNKPNALGERLTEVGAQPVRNTLNARLLSQGLETAEPEGRAPVERPAISTPGEEAPSYPGLSFPGLTVAQVADSKVMGPGVTESVFQGTEEQAPEAAMTAQDNARTEQSLIGPAAPAPDIHALVRRMDPDLFKQYDALSQQRDEFRTWIYEFQNPPDTALTEIQSQRAALEEQLAAVPTSGAGRNLPEARRLRAQIRQVQSQYDELSSRQNDFAAGQAQETPELAQARQHLLATDFQMRDLGPQVAAAYRRAADAVQGGFVAPLEEPVPTAAPVELSAPVPAPEGAAAPAATPAQPIEAQHAAIASDVTQQLIRAGRPADEAEASGQLIAARYQTRAARLGTPDQALDLYRREGAVIRGGAPAALARPAEAEYAQTPAKELDQTARGKIRLSQDARPIITLLRDANASTFVHETGHQWLEELLRDSGHDAAPDQLKNDAAAVRTWLGAAEGADIKRGQHEKFARGFEQYMREGVAPSPELAGVFAKFRNWLLNVYQTLKGLGQPINEDIRGVFDRLLSTEPQRTVVAPEFERGPSLADVHVGDAALTERGERGPVADRITAEADRFVQEPPPEIAHEIAPEIQQIEAERAATAGPAGTDNGTEAGAGTEQSGQVVPGSAEPESQPGGGVLGASGGKELRSGSEPVRESDRGTGRGGGQRPQSGAASGPQQLAPQPRSDFSDRDSPFLDKAGNIRIENLTTSQDVAQAIRDAADENNDFIGDRRGVVTDGQVMELADALGMDAAKLSTRKIGQAFNAEQIVAARRLLVQSATDVSALMKKAATDSATDEDILAYAAAKDRHQMIQAQVAGITAEAGRALRAFRSIAGQEAAQGVDAFIKQATGKTLFQLREEAKLGSTLDDAFKVSKFMQDAQNRSFGRMLMEYFVNNLISGVSTHVTYTIGNMGLLMEKLALVTPTAAAIGRLRSAMGREGNVVHFGEAAAGLRGIGTGLPAALKAVGDSFLSGVTAKLPGEEAEDVLPFQPDSGLAQAPRVEMATRYSDLVPNAFGILRGMRDGIVSYAALVKAGGLEGAPLIGARYSPLGVIPDITARGINVLPLGTAARLPSRGVAAIHTLFRVLNYSAETNQQAWRQAANEGLQGNAFYARVADLRQNPPRDMMEQSRLVSNNLTLMGQSGDFMRKVSSVFNWEVNLPILGATQPLKFIDPFVHISGQVMKRSLGEQSPLGLISSEVRGDILGKNGTVAQDIATAKMLVGSVLGITFAGLAAEGLASGSGPADPKQAAMWRLAGNQPYSVRIGDMWYATHRLGPLGVLTGIGADLYDVSHTIEQGDAQKAAALFMHAVTQNFLDEGFMRGPADLIKAVEESDRYGERYISNLAGGFVPYSVGLAQQARAMDPYAREARTFMDSIKAKIPGLSETLFPRRDIWGDPMPSFSALGGAGLTAIYEQKVGTDPVNQVLLNLGIAPGQVNRKIRNVELTDQQYDDYARIAGRMAKMRLDKIVQSQSFESLPNGLKQTVISNTIRQCRETAAGFIMARNPSIPAQAYQTKLAKLRGP